MEQCEQACRLGEKRPAMISLSQAGVRRHGPGTSVYELQDLCFFGYVASISTLILVQCAGHCNVDYPWALIAFHLLLCTVGVAAPLLAARWPHPAVRFIRWWYPALLFTFCFEAIGRMIHLIQPKLIDGSLVIAEEYVFGAMLTPLLQAHASPWLTELMYFCYSFYYFIIPVVGFVLYFRSPDRSSDKPGVAFRKFMLAVSLTFWVCYLHFLFTPAGGPVFWPAYPGPVLELRAGPITAVEQWVFRHGTIVGGAFPSSHVAVAFVAVCFAIRFSVVPAVLVPLSIGLAISTVYAGYHYGVDVLYGMIVGAVVAAISGKVFDWRERTRTVPSGAVPAARTGEDRRACDL
jgi:membrane-associated phospholipid phosphatase